MKSLVFSSYHPTPTKFCVVVIPLRCLLTFKSNIMRLSSMLTESFTSEIFKSTNTNGEQSQGTNKAGVTKYKYYVLAQATNDLGVSNTTLLVFWSEKKNLDGTKYEFIPTAWDVETTTFTKDAEGNTPEKTYVTHTIKPAL